MDSLVQAVALAAAALCAATMGFAIQRGATCTVAAVDELLRKRRAAAAAGLVEAALWVGGGLLVAQGCTALPQLPAGYARDWLDRSPAASLLGLRCLRQPRLRVRRDRPAGLRRMGLCRHAAGLLRSAA